MSDLCSRCGAPQDRLGQSYCRDCNVAYQREVGAPPARAHYKRAVRLSPAPAPAATFGGPAAGGRLKPLQTDEQERGEVAGRNFKVPDDPSAADLGLSKR